MRNLSEEQFLDLCWSLDKIGEAAWSGSGGQDTSALADAMALIKEAYIDRPTSEEISRLTNQIHALANEVAMHGWDYRPLLKANELLQALCVATEPKHWIVQLNTNWGYDDQGRRVEWNTFNLHPNPVPSDYKPGTNEVKIKAATLGSAFDQAALLYCKNDCDIRITATGYIFEENNL